MSDYEKALLKEGLKVVDAAVNQLQDAENPNIKHIASLLHTALMFGKFILE